MAKKITKIVKEEIKEEAKLEETTIEQRELAYLLDLYKTLQDLGIRSIGDLENKIANLKK